jgi:TolA-binding protein
MKKLMPTLILLFLPAVVVAQDPDDTKKADPETRFWEARRVMLAGDAASAAELFREVEKAGRGTEVADDALYWLGRCSLRLADHEPEAVAAFLRLIREHPGSPFLDDAARELFRLKDRTAVPVLTERLATQEGEAKKLTAAALAELGEPEALEVLAEDMKRRTGGKAAETEKSEKPDVPVTEASRELEELRREVARLRHELDELIDLVRRLVDEQNKKKTEGK